MVSIDWCKKQKKGIELIGPNENMSESYINMAEESITVLSDIKKSNIWIATTSYYIFYYSLYALLMKIGVKCEIHACSIEFMKRNLMCFYTKHDADMIEQAFRSRIDLQYYADRPIDKKIIDMSKDYCKIFFMKTKDILSIITEEQIETIRKMYYSF